MVEHIFFKSFFIKLAQFYLKHALSLDFYPTLL